MFQVTKRGLSGSRSSRWGEVRQISNIREGNAELVHALLVIYELWRYGRTPRQCTIQRIERVEAVFLRGDVVHRLILPILELLVVTGYDFLRREDSLVHGYVDD